MITGSVEMARMSRDPCSGQGRGRVMEDVNPATSAAGCQELPDGTWKAFYSPQTDREPSSS